MKKKNMLLIQSGGPTAVFNYTAYYLLKFAQKEKAIGKCFYSKFGLNGLINNDLGDLSLHENELTKYPGSLIGSARIKLDTNFNSEHYSKILETIKNNNIGYLFINGGNDTMDSANKLYQFLKYKNYPCNVIGIPKTIDNDLNGTDFSLGYPSAAKYVITTIKELASDFRSYNVAQVNIIETMGRHAGWLTAAAFLCNQDKKFVDLVYLPELDFSLEKFLEDVKNLLKEKNTITVVISEGVKSNGELFIAKYLRNVKKDDFAHVQLGGVAQILSSICQDNFNVKSRGIELSLMQRSAHHLISKIDLELTKKICRYSIKKAITNTNFMPIIIRRNNKPYKYEIANTLLDNVSNYEKLIPDKWLVDNKSASPELINYIKSLIK